MELFVLGLWWALSLLCPVALAWLWRGDGWSLLWEIPCLAFQVANLFLVAGATTEYISGRPRQRGR